MISKTSVFYNIFIKLIIDFNFFYPHIIRPIQNKNAGHGSRRKKNWKAVKSMDGGHQRLDWVPFAELLRTEKGQKIMRKSLVEPQLPQGLWDK